MEYKIHSFRNAETIFEYDDTYSDSWDEIKEILDKISEKKIMKRYKKLKEKEEDRGKDNMKSLSVAINQLFKEEFEDLEWKSESEIFNQPEYNRGREKETWRLDFSDEVLSVEVAFNHSSAIAWNLLKPVLASELNHVEKAIQTKAGVIITVTEDMKKAGNFDGAIGTYEKFIKYLKPLSNVLTVPIMIIGIKKPSSFKINSRKEVVEY